MRRSLDEDKRRIWEQRLERFRASGLKVARFCQCEDISVHTFNYWAKRIGPVVSPATQSIPQSLPVNEHLGGRSPSVERSGPTKDDAPLVRFLFDGGVQVLIPAHCLEAIRSLVQCVQQSTLAPPGSFHQVLVGNSARKAS